MLITLRVLRVLFGLVAAWQVLGLFPVITNWLPNLHAVTGAMWAIAFIKFIVLIVCSGVFYWLGSIKKKYENPGANTSENRIIGVIILSLICLGIVLAILIPPLSHRNENDISVSSDNSEPTLRSNQAPTEVESSTTPAERVNEVWDAKIQQWERTHTDFLSDPARRDAMQDAINSIDAETGSQLNHEELIELAFKRAAQRTGWSKQDAPVNPTPIASQFQCSGSYTNWSAGAPQEYMLNGVSIEVGDRYVTIRGAAVFDGDLAITNRMENGVGFQNVRDEAISGFFNRFSGQVSLIHRRGPKNADGSFKLFANSILSCQNASPMF